MSLVVNVQSGRNIRDVDRFGKSDPFCLVSVEGQQFTTQVIKSNLNPDWNETFTFTIANPNVAVLSLSVLDSDRGREDQFIGATALSLNAIKEGDPQTVVLPLLRKDGTAGELHLTLTATGFSGLSAEVDRLQAVSSTLETQVGDMTAQNATFKAENEKLATVRTDLENTVNTFKEETQQLQNTNNELEATKTALQGEVSKLSQKMELLGQQISDLQRTREMLDDQVTRIEAQNSQFKTELEKLHVVEEGMRQFADKVGEDYGQFVDQLTGNIKRHEELLQEFSDENEKLRTNRKKQQVDSLISMSNCFQHWDSKVGLSADEFQSYLELLGPDYSAKLKEKVGGSDEKIFGALDTDGSGTLNVAELRAILEQLVQGED